MSYIPILMLMRLLIGQFLGNHHYHIVRLTIGRYEAMLSIMPTKELEAIPLSIYSISFMHCQHSRDNGFSSWHWVHVMTQLRHPLSAVRQWCVEMICDSRRPGCGRHHSLTLHYARHSANWLQLQTANGSDDQVWTITSAVCDFPQGWAVDTVQL